ncbi:hypothetical protein [Streptococcus pluranimalium]|uniref:hypothetical protein n=1 Tax=Streptococcus pluranimalium TaxID=82348 RepID=UPI003F67A09C
MNKKLKMMSIGLLSTVMLNIAIPGVTQVVHANELFIAAEAGNTFKDLSEESILLILEAVDEMPQEMLDRGDQAEIDEYMLSKGINLKFDGESEFRSFWGCVGAITWAVGTTAIGIGMLAKVKNFVAAAGGVKAAATALMAIAKSGASSENISKFGTALVETGAVILGIKQIQDECFS